FLLAVLGKAFRAVFLDVLRGPLLAVDVRCRQVGLLAVLVRQCAGVRLNALGQHVGGGRDHWRKFADFLGHAFRGLLLLLGLLGFALLQLLGRLGRQQRLLLGIERVALGLPVQLHAGLVVLHVAGRVAVHVADVEARPRFFLELFAFNTDPLLCAIHNR